MYRLGPYLYRYMTTESIEAVRALLTNVSMYPQRTLLVERVDLVSPSLDPPREGISGDTVGMMSPFIRWGAGRLKLGTVELVKNPWHDRTVDFVANVNILWSEEKRLHAILGGCFFGNIRSA